MCSTPTYLFELKQKIQNWRTKPRCEGIKNGYQPHLIELPSEYLPDLTVFDWQQFMLTQGTLAPGKLRKEKKKQKLPLPLVVRICCQRVHVACNIG